MASRSSLFSENENDLFFFESDHLALRGNKDYGDVLKTIVILSAQREKLSKDYNRVLDIQKKVLENPQVVLEKIQNNEDLGFELPARIELPKLPVINFDKYGVTVPQSVLKEIYSDSVSDIKVEEDMKKEKNYQRTWTIEEQKRLEELLLLYPPEPVERKRYQKIAKALGNRTLAQVTSRVQKYFLKLYKAGLPIPGRMPKSVEKSNRKSAMHKHQRFNHYLWKPTTFFPEFTTPVVMDDTENTPGPSSCEPPPPTSHPTNYLLQSGYHPHRPVFKGKSYTEIRTWLLKRVKEEKLRERALTQAPFSHLKYRCDYCQRTPIKGARWRCATCPTPIDSCTDCMVSVVLHNRHPLDHVIVKIIDEDVPSMAEAGWECPPVPTIESKLGSERDSSDSEETANDTLGAATKRTSESDPNDSDAMEYGGDSNLGALANSKPAASANSLGPVTKNDSGSDSSDSEDMEYGGNSSLGANTESKPAASDDSSGAAFENYLESGSSDSEEMDYGGDSNRGALIKTASGAFAGSLRPFIKNNSVRDFSDSEEVVVD